MSSVRSCYASAYVRNSQFLMLAAVILAGPWSLVGATAIDVWAFELLPGTIGTLGMLVIARHFPFSRLVCVLIVISYVSIATGARYSFAEVPLYYWLQDQLGLARNHADRIGHFLQGLTVATLTREVLLRTTNLRRSRGVWILTIAFALAFSALYELIEWWCVELFYPEQGQEWLGLQGDIWDAQWDMTMALLGACTTALLLAPVHDRSIRSLLRQLPATT